MSATAAAPTAVLTDFRLRDLINEASHEATMREFAYADRVSRGTMTPADAERRVRMMREIARLLRRLEFDTGDAPR